MTTLQDGGEFREEDLLGAFRVELGGFPSHVSIQVVVSWRSRTKCRENQLPSLKLTFSPLKMDGWNTTFL